VKRQKLSDWRWYKIALIAYTSTTVTLTEQLVRAGTSEQYLTQIPPSVLVKGESQESQTISIAGVQLNPTETGIEIILQTPIGKAEQLQPVNLSQGNNFIVDIPNAQLEKPFRQENPVAGIRQVTVTNQDAETIRLTVVGETAAPQVELFDGDEGLIFSFIPLNSSFFSDQLSVISYQLLRDFTGHCSPVTDNCKGGGQITIERVLLEPTETGFEAILLTPTGVAQELQVVNVSQGNNFIADILNAQLQKPFRQVNPIPGVSEVTVINKDANTVRITAIGETELPSVELFDSDEGLIFGFTDAEESAQTPPTDSEIELVVTAEKTPEDLQDVPISITAITEQEVEDSDITSLSDISANTPNFSTFSPNRNFVLYSIRGLSNLNFLSRDSVAFYVDDIPYDYSNFLAIDLPDIERVEVLRGPQSTLYGRNAQAGVVNVITRKPTNEFEFNGSASYGNYDTLDLRAGVGGPLIKDELFFRLSGNYGSRDGYLENTFLDSDVDQQAGGSGRAQLLWTPSQAWEVSANASFDDYRDGAINLVFLEQEDPRKIEQNFDGFSDLISNTQSLRVAYKNPNFRVTSITARRFSGQKFENELDVTVADIFTQIGDIDSTVFSQEVRLQSPEQAERFQWLLGGYFESRDFNVNADGFRYGSDAVALGLFPSGRDRVIAELDETTFAIFASANYKPVDALTLTAGLRYESYNSTLENKERIFTPDDGSASIPTGQSFNDVEKGGDFLLPRFAAEYRFNPNIMVYGAIARGYKPPGVNYRAENEQTLIFEAEKSWNYELGVKSSWLEDRLAFNIALFYNTIDDFQVAVPNATGLFADIANAEVRIAGFEVEMRATPLEGLDFIAGFGYADGEFTDYTNPFTGENFNGNQLAYAPDFTYNLAVQYRAPLGIFARIELQGLGTTFFDDANTLKQDSFAIVNARLGYEFDNYGIYLFANNIFDTDYLTTAVAFGSFGNLATYGAPATYGVQIRAKF
jgi:iron complex outermembrane receptor protein